MFIKNGLKTNLRSRGRTALFFALIFMLTVVMTAAAGVRSYCLSAIEKCDGEFRSVALIEYLGSDYPDPDAADEDARAAFAELDLGGIGAVRGVRGVSPAAQTAVYFDGFRQQKKNTLYKDFGVVTVNGIGDPQYMEVRETKKLSDVEEGDDIISYFTDIDYDEKGIAPTDENGEFIMTDYVVVRHVDYGSLYYSARISDSVYSLSDKSEVLINLHVGDTDFVPEKGKTYVLHGAFLGKNAEPRNGRENFEVNPFDGSDEPPYEEYDGGGIPGRFLDAAAKYLRANNYVFCEYCADVRDVFIFQQGELYLKEGSYPEPGEAGGCVVSADLADKLGVGVGDTLNGELLSADPSKRYDLSPTGKTAGFRICGIALESADYTGRIWAIGEGDGSPLYGYALATLSLENEYAEDAVNDIRDTLPQLMRISLYDQGYGETVKPFRSIASAAANVLFVCAAGAVASLTLFAFVFIGRQSYSVRIMISLGTPRPKIALWLLSGAMMISGSAAVLGGIVGWLALPKVYGIAAAGTDFSSSARRYSEMSLGVRHTVDVETGFSPLPVVLCAAAVIAVSLILCVVFLRYAYRKSTPKRGVTRVRVPAGRNSTALRGSARFALLSIRRGGRGSLVVPAVCCALTAVIVVLGGVFSGWQTRLDRAYEETVIRGHAVSTNGRYYSGLVIPINDVRTLKKADGVGNVWVSSTCKYYVPGEEPKVADTSFGRERLNDWKMSGADLVSLNDLHAAKDFYYNEPVVEWLEGWDGSFLSEYECAQFKDWRAYNVNDCVPAVMSESFMEEHSLALGDLYLVQRVERGNYGVLYEGPVKLKAVGSYKQTGSKPNVFIPLSTAIPLDALADDYDPSRYNKRDVWGNIISSDYYLYEQVNFSSCRFTVSSVDNLEALRGSLSELGFSRVGRMGMIRTTVVLEDASFIKLTETLGRYISMGRAMMVLISAIVLLIGFIVSWLMVNGRKREFALMRGFGARKERIFASFFLEQAVLCFAGCAVGCLALVLSGTVTAFQLAAVGAFVLFYLAGCAISTLIIGKTKLMELFAVRD